MSEALAPFRHPLLRAVDGVREQLDQVAEANPAFLTTAEKKEAMVGLAREMARLEALQLKVLVAADDVADQHAARSAGAWLAHETRQDGAAGRRAQRLADGLDQRWPILAAAYAAGEASTAQVRVIGHALDELPTDLDPDLRVRAEQHLLGEAAHFTPTELRRLGRRVLEVLAPEVAEAHEARLLEREEQAAYDTMTLHWHRIGHGLSKATVTLPDATMDRLIGQLHAFTSPRRRGRDGNPAAPDERAPYPRQLAHAFAALLERIPEGWLPRHGSTNTTFLVTMDQAKLDQELAVAHLATGTDISAGEARRLLCTANVIPAVFGGKSRLLDLGRSRRLYEYAIRLAMTIRDKHCRAEGCDVPAAWCEGHHLRAWARGGETNLDDGVLLCPHHHHRAHDTRYDMRRLASGDYRFHRRT